MTYDQPGGRSPYTRRSAAPPVWDAQGRPAAPASGAQGRPAAPAWGYGPSFHPVVPPEEPVPGAAWPAFPPPPPSRPAPLLPPGSVMSAVGTGALAALGALVCAYVGAAFLVALAASLSGHSVGDGMTVIGYLGAWLFGAGFGAPVVASAAGAAGGFGSASFHASVSVPVPFVLTAAVVVAAALTCAAQRRTPVRTVAGAAVTALCAAPVPFVVGLTTALASRVHASASAIGGSGEATFGIGILEAALLPALVVAAVAFVTRLVTGGVSAPEWLRPFELAAAVRAAVTYVVVTAAVMSAVVLVIALVEAPPSQSPGQIAAVWAVLLPAVGVVGTELATFAPVQMSGSAAGSASGSGLLPGSGGGSSAVRTATLYGSGLGPQWYLLLLVPVLGIAVAGFRHARRRPASAGCPWAAAVASAVALTALMVAVNEYLSVSFSVGGRASGGLFGSGSGIGVGEVGAAPIGYLIAAGIGALIPLCGWLLDAGRRRAAVTAAPPAFRVPAAWSPAAGPGRAAWVQSPVTGQPAEQNRTGPSRGLTAVIAALAVAVLVGAVLVAVVLGTRGTPATVAAAGGGQAGPQAAPTSAYQPLFPSALPYPTLSFPPRTATRPTVTPAGVNVASVLDNPAEPGIAATMDTYFTGINAHNGALAASVFDPSGIVNPNDAQQVATFSRQISTTTDEQIVIHSIAVNASGGYLVALSFRSHQAPSYGPGGNEACTDWNLTYSFTGTYKLIRSTTAQHTTC